MSDKVKIKNVSAYNVTLVLPNVRFRRELRAKATCTMSDDVFEEFNYDPGCRQLVHMGVLKVITDNPEVKEQLVETPKYLEVDIEDLLKNKSVSELNAIMKDGSDTLNKNIAEEAIRLSIVDPARVSVIKRHSNIDVLESLSLGRSIESK